MNDRYVSIGDWISGSVVKTMERPELILDATKRWVVVGKILDEMLRQISRLL